GHLAHLHARDTTLALVSRAPLAELQRFQARMGWTLPWYSSWGSDFNHDFHVTQDAAVAPLEYNYRDEGEMRGRGEGWGGMPDLDGKGMHWQRLHDRYDDAEAPTPLATACCGDTP